MLGGKGFYRGSSILVSGTAGTGKTSLAAHFADAACQRGERCLYFAFEESRSQIIRNMRSIGIDLEPWVKKGLLRVPRRPPHALRPGDAPGDHAQGDRGSSSPPSSSSTRSPTWSAAAATTEVTSMLLRLIDFLKMPADHRLLHRA